LSGLSLQKEFDHQLHENLKIQKEIFLNNTFLINFVEKFLFLIAYFLTKLDILREYSYIFKEQKGDNFGQAWIEMQAKKVSFQLFTVNNYLLALSNKSFSQKAKIIFKYKQTFTLRGFKL
jgi:hypothetical protein